MLYVFNLDDGCLLSLEYHAVELEVEDLKKAIATSLSIPSDVQVLLISGGEVLSGSRKLSSYNAGHDPTNPIFLISRSDLARSSLKFEERFRQCQVRFFLA